MDIERKLKVPTFVFNTSTNPFAYIRDDEDIDYFVEAINKTNNATDNEKLDTRVLQLIWVVSSYLLNCCRPDERNIENAIKLFRTVTIPVDSVRSIFEIMIKECDNQSLKDKFNYLKIQVYGLNSNACKTIVTKSVDVMTSLPLESVTEELKLIYDTTRQGTLHNGKTKYDVWFIPAENFLINVYKNDKTKVVTIELPRFLTEKNNSKLVEMLFSQNDYNLQKLLENKAPEILSLIKKHIKTNCRAFQEVEQSKNLSKTTSKLFENVCDDTGREKQIVEHRKKLTAIHETGHVVAAYLLNEDCEGVSIEPTKTSAGQMRLTRKPENQNDIIIDYASMIAEKIWLDNKYYGGSRTRNGDAARATKYAKKLVIDECKTNRQDQDLAFIDIDELGLTTDDALFVVYETMKKCVECWENAETLISTNFYLVEALANELLERKTITGEEITRFLDNIQKKKQAPVSVVAGAGSSTNAQKVRGVINND